MASVGTLHVITKPSLSLSYWEYKFLEAECLFHVSVQWDWELRKGCKADVFSTMPRLVCLRKQVGKMKLFAIISLFKETCRLFFAAMCW